MLIVLLKGNMICLLSYMITHRCHFLLYVKRNKHIQCLKKKVVRTLSDHPSCFGLQQREGRAFSPQCLNCYVKDLLHTISVDRTSEFTNHLFHCHYKHRSFSARYRKYKSFLSALINCRKYTVIMEQKKFLSNLVLCCARRRGTD